MHASIPPTPIPKSPTSIPKVAGIPDHLHIHLMISVPTRAPQCHPHFPTHKVAHHASCSTPSLFPFHNLSSKSSHTAQNASSLSIPDLSAGPHLRSSHSSSLKDVHIVASPCCSKSVCSEEALGVGSTWLGGKEWM